ncbi:MAG: hypothetical protein QM765_41455 [Myxococcales bacterium]
MRLAPLLALVLAGCATASTTFPPKRVAEHELTLGFRDEVEVREGPNTLVATGPGYLGLTDFVWCVPDASRHAEAAEAEGALGSRLFVVSFLSSSLGLGGLAGLGFKGRDDPLMAAMLVSGAALEALSIATGAASYSAKKRAHGNAVDAVNFYNDALGFSGGGCPVRSARTAPRPKPGRR